MSTRSNRQNTQTDKGEEVEQPQESRRPIPVYVDSSEPELQDPSKEQSPAVWMAANQISFKLLRCVEAIRDLARILESIAVLDAPLSDKRGAKMLATPLYNLAVGVKDMFSELEGNAKEYSRISPSQHKELRKWATVFATEVPIGKGEDLRAVRDKIDAHIDKDAVVTPGKYWGKVDLPTYLQWIRICSEEILHLLTFDIYGWSQESGHPDVWRLMAVDGILVDWYMEEDRIVSLLSTTFTKSPKYGIAREIENLAALHNRIVSKC